MQSRFLKIIFSCLIAILAISAADAQLLHERNKLKTEKRKSKAFRLFKNDVGKSSGKTQVVRSGTPRFSKRSKSGGYNVSTRYSQSIAGQGSFRVVTPKFSKDNSRKRGFRVVNPKYSQSIAGQGSFRVVNPKYSKDIAGQGSNRSVNPKFSRDPENFGSFWRPSPKTTSNEGMVFNFPSRLYKANRIKNNGENDYNPRYSGGTKNRKNSHPSSAFLSAKYKNSKLVRNSLQKFNILLVRVNGNKSYPDGVNKKSKKTKHDKDESEIWNNEEREYSHN